MNVLSKGKIATGVLTLVIGYLVASVLVQSASAQILWNGLPSPSVAEGTPLNVPRPLHQSGTSELQNKVLTNINNGLTSGWLSISDATAFNNQLNKISATESWYQSLNMPIPEPVIESDRKLLAGIGKAVQQRNFPVVDVPNSTPREDISESIAHALAAKQISSSQAERYYVRLAQLQSNLDRYSGSEQRKDLKSRLDQLKAEVTLVAQRGAHH